MGVVSQGGWSRTGRRRLTVALATAACCALGGPALSAAAGTGLPIVDPTVPAARDADPVVLTGQSFTGWSVPANQTVKLPLTDFEDCQAVSNRDSCPHNHYEDPEVDTAPATPAGTPTDRLLGYRWDATSGRFVQIPFQVDEMFTRYLDNSASDFSAYSGEDQHTTYAYDREGYRFTANDPSNPCLAVPAKDPASSTPEPGGPATTSDPVPGLDDNDELSFMASDAGQAAPDGATLPRGIEDVRRVTIADPLTAAESYAYVMRAAADGPAPAFNAHNGYVSYQRDPNADLFQYSESNYEGYGNAPQGPYCDKDGNPVRNPDGSLKIGERRPGDYATVSTPRYSFRYDGRWLMTGIRVSPNDDGNYGPDLIDRWKARAFAQDPSSETPCCGFEDEDVNWGGSSQLLGERVGPVRAIRETWGADSGTNVIRRETFYRDEMRQKTWLRVHVIPPLDGIYAQWDFNAGTVSTYYNPKVQDGVPVDGKNDEVFGNLDDPCTSKYDAANDPNDTSQIDQAYRTTYEELQLCRFPYHLSIDVTDPTFGDLNASLPWNETTGPYGTIVDRYQLDKVTDLTPGGAPQSLAAMPYYRDDSCFDDGTGSDPGMRIDPGSANEPTTFQGAPRKCWDSAPGSGDPAIPGGDARFYQGDIGTHGLHLLFQVESDNARQTVPLDEIVSEQRMVMLPGQQDATAGEQYGRGFEKPLVATVADASTYNQPPTAAFDFSPAAPRTGDAVTFDGSGSGDPDGSVAKYEWDLDGNGSFETDTGTTPTVTHSYANSGTYAVSLRVTDDDGGTDVVSHGVTASDRSPQEPPPPQETPPPPAASPPDTKITKATVNSAKHRAKFTFNARGEATGFQCRLGRAAHFKLATFRDCSSPKTYARLKRGRYLFRVRAVGPGGPDPTPAKKAFRIN